MGAFDRDPFQQLVDPYSDRRMLTQHDLTALREKYDQTFPSVSPEFRDHPEGHREGDLKYNALSEQEIHDQAIGKIGFSGTRIMQHYGDPSAVPQLTKKELDEPVDLTSKEARMKALSQLTQNAANPLEADSGMQCGASTMLGAAMYGGGNEGVKKLLDAMIADHAKEKIVDKDAKAPWMDEDFKKVLAKLKDPNVQLTRGDLAEIQSKSYQHFKAENLAGKKNTDVDDPANGGLVVDKLNQFIGRHKDISKMFKDNDMGLDSIDHAGVGRPNHFVLGIGHHHDFTGGNETTRDMVFDPQARQDKRDWGDFMSSDTQDKVRSEERAKMQGDFDKLKGLEGKAWETQYDKLQTQLDFAVHQRQWAYKSDSQLVTDQHELTDYRKATTSEANGDPKLKLHKSQTKPENPFSWMF